MQHLFYLILLTTLLHHSTLMYTIGIFFSYTPTLKHKSPSIPKQRQAHVLANPMLRWSPRYSQDSKNSPLIVTLYQSARIDLHPGSP